MNYSFFIHFVAIGTTRKRRLSNAEKFYVEIGEQLSVKRIYTYVKFIPYRIDKNYTLTNNSLLCPKLDYTDVRCINEADCAILESAGISCKPTDSRRVGGVGPSSGKDDDDDVQPFTYIIPIALIMLLVVVVLFLLYRRRKRPVKVNNVNVNF